jgi:hypothetical protein
VISFRPKALNDKDASVVLLASGQTHAHFKKELEKGKIYPVAVGPKTFVFVGLGKTDKLSLTSLRIQG